MRLPSLLELSGVAAALLLIRLSGQYGRMPALAILIIIILTRVVPFDRRLYVSILLVCCSLIFLLPPSPLPEEVHTGMRLSGQLLEDPRQVRSDLYLLHLRIDGITSGSGLVRQEGAFGACMLMAASDEALFWGDRVEVEVSGLGDDGLLFGRDLKMAGQPQVLLLQFRKIAIGALIRRYSELPYDVGALCRLLILGECGDPHLPLLEYMTLSGTRHLVALSGMHLMLIAFGLRLLVGRLLPGRAGSILTSVLLLCYIFLAGFSPSLVRAGILYLTGLGRRELPLRSRLFLTLVVHLLLFPDHVDSIGFLLSYAALYAIISSSLTQAALRVRGVLLKPAVSLLAASAAASIYTLAIQLSSFGRWSAGSVPASLVLTPLVMAYMVLSLVYPVLPFIEPVITGLHSLIEHIAVLFSRCPAVSCSLSLAIPVDVLFLLITAVRHLLLCGRISHNRREEQVYEHDISLRFTKRDTVVTGGAGPVDEQAVRPELPPLRGSPGADHRGHGPRSR